jgi:tRNA (guanine37-N1)-methyltransferase
VRFDVITLFPDLFGLHVTQGVTRRAFESGQVDLRLWQLRDFADDGYRRVDDRPYGGGPGMVMLVEPLERALAAVRTERADSAPLVHFTPTGRRIDQRFVDRHVDIELSLGDFVLSGGELPALVLLDAVARLQDGVLGDVRSHQQDSFSDGLLDCPHYSRPEVLAAPGGADAVPPVLLSGHHADISRWRREQSLRLTLERRPDLIAAARAAGRLSEADENFLATFRL